MPIPRVRDAWALFFAEVRELARAVRDDGATLNLLMFPFRQQVRRRAPEPIPQRLVRGFCEKNEIPFLDGLSVLKPLGRSAFIDYDHLTPEGAAAIADLVMESGVLPSR